jgi:hypothetical protein
VVCMREESSCMKALKKTNSPIYPKAKNKCFHQNLLFTVFCGNCSKICLDTSLPVLS